jgi:fibronectin-binding autotransporter adhesin
VLSYSTNAVNLSLQRNDISFGSIALTPNQHATAAAADELGFVSPAYAALTTLDVPTARHAFDQLSGVIHASTTSALIDDSRYLRDTINRHLLGTQHNGAEGRIAGGGSVWASAWGHGGQHHGDGNAVLMHSNGSGLLVGADLSLGPDGRLGAVVGHGQSSIQSVSVSSSAHVLSDQAGLYASGTFGAFALRGGAVYAWQNVTTHRRVAFGSFSDQLRSEHHARTTQGYVEGGYRFDFGHGQQLEPFVNLARIHVHQDGLREGGGSAALLLAADSASLSKVTLGLRDTFAFDTANTIHGHASVGWQQAWGDLTPVRSMRFASGGNSFAISGVPVATHAVSTDLGVDFKLAKNVSLDASYLGQFGGGVTDQGARMSLTIGF